MKYGESIYIYIYIYIYIGYVYDIGIKIGICNVFVISGNVYFSTPSVQFPFQYI